MAGREFEDTAAVVCMTTIPTARGSVLGTKKESKHGL